MHKNYFIVVKDSTGLEKKIVFLTKNESKIYLSGDREKIKDLIKLKEKTLIKGGRI